MACYLLSEFEKGQIVVYNDCGQLCCNIANRHHLSIDIFFLTYKKSGGGVLWR